MDELSLARLPETNDTAIRPRALLLRVEIKRVRRECHERSDLG
jgi:hypothetical protein